MTHIERVATNSIKEAIQKEKDEEQKRIEAKKAKLNLKKMEFEMAFKSVLTDLADADIDYWVCEERLDYSIAFQRGEKILKMDFRDKGKYRFEYTCGDYSSSTMDWWDYMGNENGKRDFFIFLYRGLWDVPKDMLYGFPF